MINARILGGMIAIIFGSEGAFQKRYCRHVLQAMVSVGMIAEGALFIDNAERCFMRFDLNRSDLIQPIFDLWKIGENV
jgi:hypothetical protein